MDITSQAGITIITTTIGSICGFLIKSIWDSYSVYKENVRQNKIKKLAEQLSKFYWPLYIRLETNDDINHRITAIKLDANERGLYRSVIKCDNCNIIIHEWMSRYYCAICDFHLCVSCRTKIQHQADHNLEYDQRDIDANMLKKKLCYQLEQDNLIPNNHEIRDIILNNTYICEPDNNLKKYLLQYIQYVDVYSALRRSDEAYLFPENVNINIPAQLREIIRKRTFELQNEYNSLIT